MKTVLALAAALLLAACGGPKQITIDHGWVRLAAVQGHPAAAYFTIHGGPADATLMDVDSPVAIRSQMHETVTANGVDSMQPIEKVPVPAGGTVKFAPGVRHVMLFNLSPSVKPGGTVPLRFTFTDGSEFTIDAKAIAAGDPAPSG